LSSICPSAHQPALFFIQLGIASSEPAPCSVGGMLIIPFDISHCTPETNEPSSICPSAHHPAVFLIQSGISETYGSAANDDGVIAISEKIVSNTNAASYEFMQGFILLN